MIGLVAEDGRACLLQEDGVMYWGPVTSRLNQIAATMEGAGIYGNPLWDESSSGKLTVTGTIRARDSISANSTFVTRYGGRTTSTAALTCVPMYEDDSSLDVVAGNYSDATGYFEGVLNIASSGQVFLRHRKGLVALVTATVDGRPSRPDRVPSEDMAWALRLEKSQPFSK